MSTYNKIKPLLIAGPSCSGKSTKAKEITSQYAQHEILTISCRDKNVDIKRELWHSCTRDTRCIIFDDLHTEELLYKIWDLAQCPLDVFRIGQIPFSISPSIICVLNSEEKDYDFTPSISSRYEIIKMEKALFPIDFLIKKLSEYGTVEAIKEGVVFSLLLTGQEMSKMIKFQSIQKLVLDYTQEKYPYVEILQNSDTYVYMILKAKSQDPHEERGVHIMKPAKLYSIEKYWKLVKSTDEYLALSEEEKNKCRLGFNFGVEALYSASINVQQMDGLERKMLSDDLNMEIFNICNNLNLI